MSGPPTAETGYGLPPGALEQILGLLQSDPAVEAVLLYGSITRSTMGPCWSTSIGLESG